MSPEQDARSAAAGAGWVGRWAGNLIPGNFELSQRDPWIPEPASEPKTIFFMYMKEGKRKEAKGRESRRNTPSENVGVPPACKRLLN